MAPIDEMAGVQWNEGLESWVPGMNASFRSGVLRVSGLMRKEGYGRTLMQYVSSRCQSPRFIPRKLRPLIVLAGKATQ